MQSNNRIKILLNFTEKIQIIFNMKYELNMF